MRAPVVWGLLVSLLAQCVMFCGALWGCYEFLSALVNRFGGGPVIAGVAVVVAVAVTHVATRAYSDPL